MNKNEKTRDRGEHSLKAGGVFRVNHYRNGKRIDTMEFNNIVVDEGINYILDAALSGGTQTTTFYLGVFANNYTPLASNEIATFPGAGVANEVISAYDEATRVSWAEAGVTAKTIGNTTSPATFTFNNTVSVYGAFLATSATKGGTTGKLIAAGKFPAVRNMADTDVLTVSYELTGSSS